MADDRSLFRRHVGVEAGWCPVALGGRGRRHNLMKVRIRPGVPRLPLQIPTRDLPGAAEHVSDEFFEVRVVYYP